MVWFAAGIVALATGIMWGARSDVSFALQIVALKALPVLILGGLTSVPGAIVGGLIIGIGEKLGEIYWGPLVGGGIEGWLAYVDRARLPAVPAAGPVRRAHHRAGLSSVLYRETGQYKTSYAADEALFPIRRTAIGIAADPAAGAASPIPLLGSDFLLNTVHDPVPGVLRLRRLGSTCSPATPASSRSAPAASWEWAPTPATSSPPSARGQHPAPDPGLRPVLGRRSASCSACHRCASRASISRSRRSRRSSSSTGASTASPGSTTTTPAARSRCRPAPPSASPLTGPTADARRTLLRRARPRRGADLDCLEPRARPDRPRLDDGPRHGYRGRADGRAACCGPSSWPSPSPPSTAASRAP